MSGKAIPLGLVIDFKREKETFGSMGSQLQGTRYYGL